MMNSIYLGHDLVFFVLKVNLMIFLINNNTWIKLKFVNISMIDLRRENVIFKIFFTNKILSFFIQFWALNVSEIIIQIKITSHINFWMMNETLEIKRNEKNTKEIKRISKVNGKK
jgi:hypothetical protein